MKKHYFFICMLSAFMVKAQVNFQEINLKSALSMAKQQNKPVFLYAFSTWCEPCEVMDEYTFADLEVSNYYNDHFINIKMDMESYPGAEIAEEYDVTIYPGLLFFDAKGAIIHRGCGSMDSGEMLDLAKQALKEDNFKSFEDRYKSGNRDTAFLLTFLYLMEEVCLDAQGLAQTLMSEIASTDLYKESSFLLLENYQWDIYSREFQYLIANKQAFEDSLGVDRVNDKLYNTFLAQYLEIYEAEELHLFALKALMKEMASTSFIGSDTLATIMNLHYHETVEDWEKFSNDAITWVGMSDIHDAEELNELAWNFYLFVNDKNKLEIALVWAKEAVELDPGPSAIDTYASLQFKLGHTKKAIELEKQAIDMATSLAEDTDHFEYQLAKFQNK